MKILYTLFVLLFASASAFSWGLEKRAEEDPFGPGFAMVKIISNKPISYFIKENTQAKKRLQTRGKFQSTLSNQAFVMYALNSWFKYAADTISNTGRQQEFADVLPLLSSDIKLTPASSEDNADIIFYFTSEREITQVCGEAAAGCKSGIEIYIPFLEYEQTNPDLYESGDIETTVIHEIGHFLGLSDQRLWANNSSVVHSTAHRYQGTDSIMAIMGTKLGCDDVDGIINVIDWAKAQLNHGIYSQRAQRGWRTFCKNDTTVYVEAQVPNKQDVVAEQCVYSFDKSRGGLSQKRCPEPFFIGQRQMEYNENGLPKQLIDHVQNFKINYSVFKQDNIHATLTAQVMDLSTNKRLFILKAQRQQDLPGAISNWNVPYEENEVSINLMKDNTCAMYVGKSNGGFYSMWTAINPYGKLAELSYSFSRTPRKKYKGEIRNNVWVKQPIDFRISANEKEGVPYNCQISLDNTDNVLVYDAQGLVSVNEVALQSAAQQYRLTVQQLVDDGAQLCDRSRFGTPQYLKKQKDFCRFFYRVEEGLKN